LLLKRFSQERATGSVNLSRLTAVLLLFPGLTAVHAGNTIVKDYDISLSQEECRQTSMRILHSLAGPDMPVMQLEPLVYYSDQQSEFIAVCRADKGVLVVFARGLLAEQGQLAFYEAFVRR
jgi:hypothetical protein